MMPISVRNVERKYLMNSFGLRIAVFGAHAWFKIFFVRCVVVLFSGVCGFRVFGSFVSELEP